MRGLRFSYSVVNRTPRIRRERDSQNFCYFSNPTFSGIFLSSDLFNLTLISPIRACKSRKNHNTDDLLLL